jgi:hypothetical protein
MLRSKPLNFRSKIKGKLTVTVFGPDGQIKRREPNFFQRLLGLPGSRMISVNHNIVTDEGDAMIADIMAQTPARVKVDNTNGYIQVGTGWTGTTPKANTVLNTPTGTPEVMDATYPKLKGAFGAANDNVTQYRSTFEAGDLNITGIDEAGLANNITPASWDLLAYGQITPEVNVTTSDTLQVDWELTFLGA